MWAKYERMNSIKFGNFGDQENKRWVEVLSSGHLQERCDWLFLWKRERRERETKTYVFFMLVRVVNTTTRGPKIQLPGGSEYSSVRHHGHSEAIVIGFWTLLNEFWSVFKSFRQIKNLVFYSKPQYSGFHKPKFYGFRGFLYVIARKRRKSH